MFSHVSLFYKNNTFEIKNITNSYQFSVIILRIIFKNKLIQLKNYFLNYERIQLFDDFLHVLLSNNNVMQIQTNIKV